MERKSDAGIEQNDMKRKRSDASDEGEFSGLKHFRADDVTTSEGVSYYQKRAGTSGFGGQLFQTKLQTLVLLRALTRKEIERFRLGSNVNDIGAFDDLVLERYERGRTRPKLLFVQSKHKDDPTKHRVVIEEVNHKGGDYSIKKYFQSFLQIRSNFHSPLKNTFLESSLDETDHEFIIYTNAENNLSEKEVEMSAVSVDDVLYSSQGGKILRFKSHYKESLLSTLMEWRKAQLAESLANFVLSDDNSYSDLMTDEFIKCYHPLLARQVLQVGTEIFEDKTNESETKYYRECKFMSDFLEEKDTDDNFVLILRNTLYKKIEMHKFKSLLVSTEILNVIKEVKFSKPTVDTLKANKKMKIDQFKNKLKNMKESQDTITKAVKLVIRNKVGSLFFKVPSNFGNLDCAVLSQTHLNDIITKLEELFKNPETRKSNVIKIDRNSIGPHKMLNDEDIEVIGTFVGNVLDLEEETQTYIFNVNEKSLPKHAKQFLGLLKSKLSSDLNDYKFYIDVYGFPRLSLYNHKYIDDNIVIHFLNNFKIYTNQANESSVEELLIKEIAKHYNSNKKNMRRIRIKNRAMFLKAHDDIQKWWKRKEEKVPYLNENCKFFDQAKSDTNPLLAILNFMYTEKFEKNIEFQYDSINILELHDFMIACDKRILRLISEHHILTAIKINQYFNSNNHDKYIFVDLDYVMKERYYNEVCDELNNAALDVVIIKYQEQGIHEEFLDNFMEKIVAMKIILISVNILSAESAFIKDDKSNFAHLTYQSQKNVLESIIKYQGEETRLSTIIDEEAKYLVNSEILNKLVNNETITVGKPLTNTHYESIKSYYIDRQLNRFIKINKRFIKDDGNVNEEKITELHVIYDDQIDNLNVTKDYDIMLISSEKQHFDKLCDQYPTLCIHWFKRDNKELVWEKSRGKLKRIFKYVDEDDFEDYFEEGDFEYCVEYTHKELQQLDLDDDQVMTEPKAITDIEDKIVIISGEPGVGKSTLLTRFSIEKKKCDTSTWIVKVNLKDLSSEFSNWQQSEVRYDQIVRFLYKAIEFQAFDKNIDQNKKFKERIIENILSKITVTDGNKIVLNNKEKRLQGSDLFEIEVFNYLHNKGTFILLLDGFDEISPDYKKQVIDLLKILKQSKAERLWITTRSYNIQTELENNLHTFSYVLEPFSSDDQLKFLKKFWTVHLGLEKMKDTVSLTAFYKAIMAFYDKLKYQDVSFTSIPMHIYMIARIFQDIFKEYHDGNMEKNPITFSKDNFNNIGIYLYEQYIDIKIREIFFKEKIDIKNMDDPSMIEIVEEKIRKSKRNHKLLAVHAIFNAVDISGLISKDDENEIQKLINTIESGKERIGFVDRIVNGHARFVHETFAEYFASVFLSDVLKCNCNTDLVWEFLLDIVFNTFANIRIFFDGIMVCDVKLYNYISHTDHRERIFNLLIKQGNDPLNSTTALSYASIENLDKILGVLMNSLEGNVKQDNLDDFIQLVRKGDFLPNAIENCKKNIAVNVFRIVKEIDRSKLIDIIHYMDEYIDSSPVIGAIRSFNDEMLDIVLSDITDVELVSIFKIKDPNWSNRTLLHQLYGGFKLMHLEHYLVKLNTQQLMEIAMMTDDFERKAAHYAGKHLGVYFLQFFQKRLQEDHLRTLCRSRDVDGKTVMDYLEQKKEDMYENDINWYTGFISLVNSDD